MPPAIKFCGLTRAEDAIEAARLGASYVGVVLAEGPRQVRPANAGEVLSHAVSATGRPKRVGVFVGADVADVAIIAKRVELDVVQLHGEYTDADIAQLRRRFDGDVWAVIRLRDALPPDADALFAAADGVVFDTRIATAPGGTGESFDWEMVARALGQRARPRKLIIAGGLRPGNVAGAIAALDPDVVDVSSGVERAPGVKDHALMREFVDAVRGIGAPA